MIKLKGQTESGEWVEFEASSICRADKTYMIVWTGYDPYYELLLIDTIQLADDPRKAMLDELRNQINNLPGTNYTCAGDVVYIPHEVNREKVLAILDEMYSHGPTE